MRGGGLGLSQFSLNIQFILNLLCQRIVGISVILVLLALFGIRVPIQIVLYFQVYQCYLLYPRSSIPLLHIIFIITYKIAQPEPQTSPTHPIRSKPKKPILKQLIIIITHPRRVNNNPCSPDQKTLATKQVHTSLINKYTHKFHFYLAKPINQLVYNHNKSVLNNVYKDVTTLADDTEFLNRVYWYFNVYGKEEIYQRIRLISGVVGFYGDRPFMYEYPMIIITGTIKIFKTRERRLRKMIASDGSSDESQADNDDKQSFPSQGFLNSMSSVVSESSIASMFRSVAHKIDYEQDVYNIYGDSVKMFEISSLKQICNTDQTSISYLVCDFGDIDIERTLADYDKIMDWKSGKGHAYGDNYQTLTSIAAKKPVYQSIIINQNKNQEHLRQNKYSRMLSNKNSGVKVSRMSKQQKLRVEECIKQRRITSGDKLYRETEQQRVMKKHGPRIQDIEDRDWRRRKIRDKATELLNRVKSQNYLNGRGGELIRY